MIPKGYSFRLNSQVRCFELGQSLGFLHQTLAPVMAGSSLLPDGTTLDTNLGADFSVAALEVLLKSLVKSDLWDIAIQVQLIKPW